jgi:hypothetical protein
MVVTKGIVVLLYISAYTIKVKVLYVHVMSGGTEPLVPVFCIRCAELLSSLADRCSC